MSADGPKSPSPDSRRGVWRVEIAIRIRELEHRLRAAKIDPPVAPMPVPLDETVVTETSAARITVQVEQAAPPPRTQEGDLRQAHIRAVHEALDDAAAAIEDRDWLTRLRGWWTGTYLTAGWESVHDAEAELVGLERDESARAALPGLLTWLSEVMPSGEERTRYETELRAFVDGSKPLDRTVVQQAYRDTIIANNEKHASLRAFRNLLALVSAGLAALLVALAIWHAINPNVVSLCGTSRANATAGATPRCVTDAKSRPLDVAEIELVGAIGGLLSIAFGLGGAVVAPPRYNPRPQQALLKPIAGAATGLIGVMLIQSDILVAPAGNVSESLLLAYAAIFGVSQQLLTQFVDKRAGQLLGQKDAGGSGGTG
jgi:hypothetical protein